MEDDNKKNSGRIVSIDDALRNGRPEEEEDSEYAKKVKRHRIVNRLSIAVLFLIVIGVMGYLLLIKSKEPYSAIGFEWEQKILTAPDSQYINFDGGVLQYGPQGAGYFTAENKDAWAAAYSMKNPKAICQGEYALIVDQGAKKAVVLSAESGLVGEIATEKMITKGTVSSYGAVALIQEEELSNNISFFDKTGKALDITVHTLVSQSGYPVDIAFSPDGQMLIASFVYIDSGVTQNQIVFYNFDEQRNTTGVVSAFRQYGDTIFADVAFLDNDHAVAFGDGTAVVYNVKNKTAPEEKRVIEFDEEMTQIAYGEDGIVVATKNDDITKKHTLYYYDINGNDNFKQDTDFDLKSIVLTKNGVYLVGDTALQMLTTKGNVYFSGSLECDVLKLNNPKEDNELLLVTNQRVVFLKLFRG